jgi:hypothetical protein
MTQRGKFGLWEGMPMRPLRWVSRKLTAAVLLARAPNAGAPLVAPGAFEARGMNDPQSPGDGAGVAVQTPPLRECTHAAPVIRLSASPPAMAVLPSADSATE